MHPVDKKNRIITWSIIASSAILIILTAIQNPYFLNCIYVAAGISSIHRFKFKHFVLNTLLLLLLFLPSLFILENILVDDDVKITMSNKEVFLNIGFFVFLFLAGPLYLLSLYYKRITIFSKNYKRHYQLIESQPHLICTHHFTRTFKEEILGYKSIKCRIGKDCLEQKHIQKASKLVGLIGIIENGKTIDGDYHTTLWDYRYRKIRYGDFDIIEIHSNKKIKDYDFIISKIITFYSNEINSYKPLNRIEVKIIGQPAISENTKRLMEKYFYKVEVVQEELEAVLI